MLSLCPRDLAKLRFAAQQLAMLPALGEYRDKQQLCPGDRRDMLRLALRTMKAESSIVPEAKRRGDSWIGLDQGPPTRE